MDDAKRTALSPALDGGRSMRAVLVALVALGAACAPARPAGGPDAPVDAGVAADAGCPSDLADRFRALDDSCGSDSDCVLVGTTTPACSGGSGFDGRAVNHDAEADAEALVALLASDACAGLRADPVLAPLVSQDWPGVEDHRCVNGRCQADFLCACLCPQP